MRAAGRSSLKDQSLVETELYTRFIKFVLPSNRVTFDMEGNFGQCVLNGEVSYKSLFPGNFGVWTDYLSLIAGASDS